MANRRSFYQRKPWSNLYSLARWKRLRARQLADQPLCKFCQQEDIVTAAEVVDHITEHKGDELLFWDPENLQSLCKVHHDKHKKIMENGGARPIPIGADGYPIELGGV